MIRDPAAETYPRGAAAVKPKMALEVWQTLFKQPNRLHLVAQNAGMAEAAIWLGPASTLNRSHGKVTSWALWNAEGLRDPGCNLIVKRGFGHGSGSYASIWAGEIIQPHQG